MPHFHTFPYRAIAEQARDAIAMRALVYGCDDAGADLVLDWLAEPFPAVEDDDTDEDFREADECPLCHGRERVLVEPFNPYASAYWVECECQS